MVSFESFKIWLRESEFPSGNKNTDLGRVCVIDESVYDTSKGNKDKETGKYLTLKCSRKDV